MRVIDVGISDVVLDLSQNLSSDILTISMDDEGQEIYNYVLRSKIDLRRAVGVSSIRFSLYSKATQKSSSFFANISEPSGINIIEEIKNSVKKRKIQTVSKNSDFLIGQYDVDFTKEINNTVASNISNLNDSQAFGQKRVVSLVTPSQISTVASLKDITCLENTSDLINIRSNGKSFASNSKALLHQKVDPAQSFLTSDISHAMSTTENEISGLAKKHGLQESSRLKYSLQAASDSLRSRFNSSRFSSKALVTSKSGHDQADKGSEDHSLNRFKSNDLIPITKRVDNRMRNIESYISLKRSQIPNTGTIFLKIEALDEGGLIMQTRDVTINHSENLKMFRIPRVPPRIVATAKSINNCSIEVTNTDPNITSAMVFYKTLSGATLDSDKFTLLRKIYFNIPEPETSTSKIFEGYSIQGCEKPNQRTRSVDMLDQTTRLSFTNPSNLPVIFRVVGVGKEGEVLSNFNTTPAVSFKSKYVESGITIFGNVNSSGINLKFENIPSDTVFLTVMRRDLSRHERVLRSDYTVKSRSNHMDVQGASILEFTDLDVVAGGLYEYKARVTNAYGDTVLCPPSWIEKFNKPSNSAKVELSVSSPGQGSNKKSNKSLFVVKVIQPDSTIDDFIKSVDDRTYDAYKDEIESLRSQFKSSSKILAERIDLVTNNVERAVFVPGEYTDDGRMFSSPASDNTYVYRFQPILVSPDEIIADLKVNQGLKNNVNYNDPRQRSRAAEKSKSDVRTTYKNSINGEVMTGENRSSTLNNTEKFFSLSSLDRGTLDYQRVKDRDSDGRTFDFVSYRATANKNTLKIKKGSIRVASQNGFNDVLLQWSATPISNQVDYFVISAKVLDRTYIVGAAHNVSSGGGYSYVTQDFRNFTGRVEFMITAVSTSGKADQQISLGEVVLENFLNVN